MFVGENGSQAMQRAGAFAARADDPTAIYHNPAGLARARETEFFFGCNVLDMALSFQREGSYSRDEGLFADRPAYAGDPYPDVEHRGPPVPIPFLALTIPAGRFGLGVGLFVPHGYAGGNFPEEVTTESGARAPAPQRYDLVTTDGSIMAMPSVSVAYRVTDRLRLGVRFSWVYASLSSVAYGQAIANEAEQSGLDARGRITGSDLFTPQVGLGAQYQIGNIELGAAYTSPVAFHLVGRFDAGLGETLASPLPGLSVGFSPVPDSEARCAPGGRVGDIKACLSFTIPQTAVVAGRLVARDSSGRERADLELDVRWEDWSSASNQTVTIDGTVNVNGFIVPITVPDQVNPMGFHDSFALRLGGSLAVLDGALTLRGGVAHDTAPAPGSWTRLAMSGQPANTVAGGMGIRLSSWRLDVGVARIWSPRLVVQDAASDGGAGSPAMQPDIQHFVGADGNPFNAGVYERSFWIVSLGATRQFGR